MKQIIIESTDKRDTAADIEDKLEKAYTTMQSQRESKTFSDLFLRDSKGAAEQYMLKIINSMCEEIENIIKVR